MDPLRNVKGKALDVIHIMERPEYLCNSLFRYIYIYMNA